MRALPENENSSYMELSKSIFNGAVWKYVMPSSEIAINIQVEYVKTTVVLNELRKRFNNNKLN